MSEMEYTRYYDNPNRTYFKDGKCIACEYVPGTKEQETEHIQSCPVNPHPGYVDRTGEVDEKVDAKVVDDSKVDKTI